MNILELRNAIIQYIYDNWTSTPIAYPGKDFNPATQAPAGEWIRVTIMRGDAFIGEPVNGGAGHRRGVLHIGLCMPRNAGDIASDTYIAELEELFNMKENEGVLFDMLNIGERVVDEFGVYYTPIRIPFACLTNC